MSDKINKINSVDDGFMDPDEFKKKYDTVYNQRHKEEYLDEVSKEERELFTDVQILTARDSGGTFNRFNNTGHNKGKTYDTVNKRLLNSFKRVLDGRITNKGEEAFWKPLFDKLEDGDHKFFETMLNRAMGKPVEHIQVKTDGNIIVDLNIPQKFVKITDE